MVKTAFLNDLEEAVSIVFSRPKYIAISALLAVFIYLLLLFFGNIPLFVQLIKTGAFAAIPSGLSSVIRVIVLNAGYLPIFLMGIVAVLSGIDIAMIIFKLKETTAKITKDLSSVGGISLAALGAGCSACPTTLLALLGLSGALASLPFKGIEITVLSIALLMLSILYISKGINAKTCRIK